MAARWHLESESYKKIGIRLNKSKSAVQYIRKNYKTHQVPTRMPRTNRPKLLTSREGRRLHNVLLQVQ